MSTYVWCSVKKKKKRDKKQRAGAITHHQFTHEKAQRLTQKKKAHIDTHVVNWFHYTGCWDTALLPTANSLYLCQTPREISGGRQICGRHQGTDTVWKVKMKQENTDTIEKNGKCDSSTRLSLLCVSCAHTHCLCVTVYLRECEWLEFRFKLFNMYNGYSKTWNGIYINQTQMTEKDWGLTHSILRREWDQREFKDESSYTNTVDGELQY